MSNELNPQVFANRYREDVRVGFNWNRFTATSRTPLTFTLRSDSVAPVPEPASLLLVATGLAGIVARFRRRKP